MVNPEKQSIPEAEQYKILLDQRFALGTPRRHGVGQGLGEEELFLEPPEGILLMDTIPDRALAIRPKANNTARVRPPEPDELRGHRLEVRGLTQGERSFSTVFYIARTTGQLWRQDSSISPSRYVRLPIKTDGLNQHVSYDLGPLEPYASEDRSLEPHEAEALFEYIPQLDPRGPWEDWE